MKRTLAGIVPTCGAVLIILTGCADGDRRAFRLSAAQLTEGEEHHFFGNIGQSLTIPWSADVRYVLALEAAFRDRLPGPDDPARVVLIDTSRNNEVVAVDETRAWNLQQGTMFYWNPEAPSRQFFFNDRDRVTSRVFCVLYDAERRVRLREYRFADYSIGNGGVSPQGGFFAAINYGRMARLRPVTGYAGALDPTAGVAAPENDGFFRVDIDSGRANLLVSFRDLAAPMAKWPHWVRDGKRWQPVAQGGPAERPDPEGDRALSPDGRWFVNGYSSPNRETITYRVMRLEEGVYAEMGPFDRGPYTNGNLRTDPAPLWNRVSDAVLVPGWTEEGTRQLFVIRIDQP